MNLNEVLKKIAQERVKISITDGQMRIRVGKAGLSDELREMLKAQKPALIQWYEELESRKTATVMPLVNVLDHDNIQLSFSQQRLWLLNKLQPQSVAYNITEALSIEGALDVSVLAKVMQTITERHQVLRTSFVENKGVPRQVINPLADNVLHIEDIQASDDVDVQVNRLIEQQANRVFNLAKDALFAPTLVIKAPEQYVLVLAVHHIVFDGWSMNNLMAEISSLYEAFSAGKENPLADTTWQYADYAYSQREWLKGTVLKQQQDYWLKQLADVSELTLPVSKPGYCEVSDTGSTLSFSLPEQTVADLNLLAKNNETTLYVTLLAVFKILLARYANNQDVCVGTPVADRGTQALSELMGPLINTLALRTDLTGLNSFHDVLNGVKTTVTNGFLNQDLPFEQVVEALKVPRSTQNSPLFQVMFGLQQSTQDEDVSLSGLVLKPINLELPAAQYDMTLDCIESEGQIRCELNYKSQRFDADLMAGFARHFVAFATLVSANPTQPVTSLPLLSDEEIKAQLAQSRTHQSDYPTDVCLHQLVEQQALQSQSDTALMIEGEALCYEDLNQSANQLAHYLTSVGVTKGDVVGLCIDRSIEMMVSILAVLKAGAAYAPIDVDHPQERINYIVNDAQPKVVITNAQRRSLINSKKVRVFCVDIEWDMVAEQPKTPLDSGVTSKDPAYILYTSGSTGQPKGVVVPHQGIVNRVLWMGERMPLTADDRVLQKTAFSFDVSVCEIFWPLTSGATLVMAAPGRQGDPVYLVNTIKQFNISQIHFVPSMLSVFLTTDDIASCTSIKRLLCSGEVLTGEQVNLLHQQLACEVYNLYGPTEASVDVSCWQSDGNEYQGNVPIGQPVANTQLLIIDAQGRLQPQGLIGEIVIAGVQLADGYLNKPQLTEQAFVTSELLAGQRIYKTGDLGRVNSQGELEYIGRIDQQVKLRGYRIELSEIEVNLNNIKEVEQAVVVIKNLPGKGPQIVAYVVMATDLDNQQLRQELALFLPDYMLPSAIVKMTQLPRLTSQKIDRKQLPMPDESEFGQRTFYVAPETKTEKALAAIWQDVLKVERVSKNDNFFDIGGHSLLATQVMARIAEQWHIQLTLFNLFNRPTLGEAAGYIDILLQLKQDAQTMQQKAPAQDGVVDMEI